jgi:hypothetical protein
MRVSHANSDAPNTSHPLLTLIRPSQPLSLKNFRAAATGLWPVSFFRIKQISPDSKRRLDRGFVSAGGARHAQLDSSHWATSVFLLDQFRARQ